MNIAESIELYLRTGESDPLHRAWPGADIIERCTRGQDGLLDALANEVGRRTAGRIHPPVPALDLKAWTRQKLTPMAHGLFAATERELVLALLEKSVVFLTAESVDGVLRGQVWLPQAWDLANLYLLSTGAELLGPEAPRLVGLSSETACYVSALYFLESNTASDFVIHEAAHIFHNWKRARAGLRSTPTREWLLPVAFTRRETFAYSCEAYGWVMEQAANGRETAALLDEFAAYAPHLTEPTIEPEEVVAIVRAACTRKNGWKYILSRCAEPATPRH